MAQSQTLIEEYLDILKFAMPLDVMVLGYITLARIRFADKNHGEALALLREAEEVASQHNLSRLVVTVGQERVRLALRRDDLVGAQRWYSEMKDREIWKDFAGRTMSANDPETPEVFDLRLMVRLGKASEALKPLTTALSRAESTGRRWQALVLQIIQAQALDACGDRNAALEALGEALSFAVPQGFVRTFADEGAPVARLLRGLRKTVMADRIDGIPGVGIADLDRILIATGEKVPKAEDDERPELEAPPQSLSVREAEVLEMTARGLSNSEVAEKLFLSESTVKFHLHNVNLKLGTKNRTRAIMIARHFGMIS